MNKQNRRIIVEENKMKEETEKVCSLKGGYRQKIATAQSVTG